MIKIITELTKKITGFEEVAEKAIAITDPAPQNDFVPNGSATLRTINQLAITEIKTPCWMEHGLFWLEHSYNLLRRMLHKLSTVDSRQWRAKEFFTGGNYIKRV